MVIGNKQHANRASWTLDVLTAFCTEKERFMRHIRWNDFQKVELRIVAIVEVQDFSEARNPAFKLHLDLGQGIGIRKSSAQITDIDSKKAYQENTLWLWLTSRQCKQAE